MTVREALDAARQRLEAAGVREAALDAELLLRHVLGWDRARIVTEGDAPLDADARHRFDLLVAGRATRRPLQHLTGRQAFWRHDFVVTPDVLAPRPETEHLVETALAWLGDRPGARVVDVGTGTGCIALSIAAERRDARVVAVDLSSAALAVARRNAVRLGIALPLVRADLLSAIRGADLVVSNPPYVEEAELALLEPEVRDHEPRMALVPPQGPLALYAQLAREAFAVLASGGMLMVEVGAGQADAVSAAFAQAGLEPAGHVADLAGIPRVVTARRP